MVQGSLTGGIIGSTLLFPELRSSLQIRGKALPVTNFLEPRYRNNREEQAAREQRGSPDVWRHACCVYRRGGGAKERDVEWRGSLSRNKEYSLSKFWASGAVRGKVSAKKKSHEKASYQRQYYWWMNEWINKQAQYRIRFIGVRATLRTVPPLAHQNTKISKFSNYQNSTKMGSIEEAIADLKSQEHPNITATAKKHGCNRSTLSKRYRSADGLVHATGSCTIFSP